MRNKLFQSCLCLAIISILFACGSNTAKNPEPKKYNEFVKVEVPAMTTSQSDALLFLGRKYWSNFLNEERVNNVIAEKKAGGGKGQVLGLDTIKFEEVFGEYSMVLNILQPINYPAVCSSVKELLSSADKIALAGDSSLFLTLAAHFEKYFYDPNSPVLNEEVYIPALEGILAAQCINELDKMQYEYQLTISNLNRIGASAADFGYTTLANGVLSKSFLYKIKSPYTLIMFNNPDCPSCAEIRDLLKSHPVVGSLINEGELKILAIYTDSDVDLWKNKRDAYPNEWIYAYDHTFELNNNQIYGLRAIPSLYLLDKDKKVILKDAKVEQVIKKLSELN